MPTRRCIILLCVILLYTLVMMICLTIAVFVIGAGSDDALRELPGVLVDLVDEPQWWTLTGIGWVILVAAQIVCLIPVVRVRPPKGSRAKSLTVSLVIGAGMASLLTTALASGVISFIHVIAGVLMEDALRLREGTNAGRCLSGMRTWVVQTTARPKARWVWSASNA